MRAATEDVNEVWRKHIKTALEEVRAVDKEIEQFKKDQKKLVVAADQFALDSKKEKIRLQKVIEDLNAKAGAIDAKQHQANETSAEAKKKAAEAKSEYAELSLMVKKILQDEQIMEKGKQKNLEAVLASESAAWSDEESNLREQLAKLETQVREQRVVLKKNVDALYAQRREEDQRLKLERADRKEREATEGYEPLSINLILQQAEEGDMTLASSFTHEHMQTYEPNDNCQGMDGADADTAAGASERAQMNANQLNQHEQKQSQFVRAASAAVIPQTSEWAPESSTSNAHGGMARASGQRRVVSVANHNAVNSVMRENRLSNSRKRSLAVDVGA